MTYRFINDHRHEFRFTTMRRVLRVARACFYQWLHKPMSNRAMEDQRLGAWRAMSIFPIPTPVQ